MTYLIRKSVNGPKTTETCELINSIKLVTVDHLVLYIGDQVNSLYINDQEIMKGFYESKGKWATCTCGIVESLYKSILGSIKAGEPFVDYNKLYFEITGEKPRR